MSDTVTVRTNNVPRETIEGWQLSEKERKDFDYLDWEAIEDGRDSATFFRYKGDLYFLGDFMRWSATSTSDTPSWMDSWDGYSSDSFFSGMLVRYGHSTESVVVGRYYS